MFGFQSRWIFAGHELVKDGLNLGESSHSRILQRAFSVEGFLAIAKACFSSTASGDGFLFGFVVQVRYPLQSATLLGVTQWAPY
jgi:hypothetical protein